MLKTAISKSRAGLGFPDAVLSSFKFLVEDFGFSCVTHDVTYVRYESRDIFVNVYHGRASFELNVEIGEQVSREFPENPFTLGEILNSLNPQEAENYQPYQVRTAESVKKFVAEMARLVKEYAPPALMGNHDFFQQISETRQQRSDELLRSWDLNRARRDVEKSWQKKDFKHIVEVYEPVKEYLTPAETKKLEYAKKMCVS